MRLDFYTINNEAMSDCVRFKVTILKQPIFNFYSFSSYGIRLPYLGPTKDIVDKYLINTSFDNGDEMTYEFDRQYAIQLIQNNQSFMDLMQIMSALNDPTLKSNDVIVLTNYENPFVQIVMDSLIKFIQQRYGVQSYIINDVLDITDFDFSEFSMEGYNNFVNDMQRVAYLTTKDASDLYKKYGNDYYANFDYLCQG